LSGRFLSEDPIGLEGGINPYVFGGTDKINRRDPTGTEADDGCPTGFELVVRVTRYADGREVVNRSCEPNGSSSSPRGREVAAAFGMPGAFPVGWHGTGRLLQRGVLLQGQQEYRRIRFFGGYVGCPLSVIRRLEGRAHGNPPLAVVGAVSVRRRGWDRRTGQGFYTGHVWLRTIGGIGGYDTDVEGFADCRTGWADLLAASRDMTRAATDPLC
jgi:hypothetical protein